MTSKLYTNMYFHGTMNRILREHRKWLAAGLKHQSRNRICAPSVLGVSLARLINRIGRFDSVWFGAAPFLPHICLLEARGFAEENNFLK